MAVTFFPSNPHIGRAIGNYNQGLSAEYIARMQNDAAIQQAEIQARAQQQQLQQQGQQQAQVNALQQQELQQRGFFQRGQLSNQEKEIAAIAERNKAVDASTAAWREAQMRPRLAEEERQAAYEEKETAMLVAESENLAKARNEHGKLTGALAKLSAMETAQTQNAKLPEAPGTLSRGFWGTGSGGLLSAKEGNYRSGATKADGTKIGGVDFSGARTRLKSQLDQLESYIKGSAKLDATLTKQPDGTWVSTLRSALGMQQTPGFFGGGGMTAAPAVGNDFRFFNDRGTAPAVASVPAVPAQPRGATGSWDSMITVRTSDGKIRTGPESAWPKLKAEDPGAEIISAQQPPADTFSQPAGSPLPTTLMQRFFAR